MTNGYYLVQLVYQPRKLTSTIIGRYTKRQLRLFKAKLINFR